MTSFFRSAKFPIFLIVFVDVIGLGITIPVLPVYAEGYLKLSGLQIAGLTSMFFAAQFIGAPILGRLSDRIGRRPVLIASQLGTLTGAILTAVALSPLYLVAARIIDGLTGGNISVAQAYLTDITPPADRAKSVGLVIAAFGLGFIIGPAFGAFMSASFGPRRPSAAPPSLRCAPSCSPSSSSRSRCRRRRGRPRSRLPKSRRGRSWPTPRSRASWSSGCWARCGLRLQLGLHPLGGQGGPARLAHRQGAARHRGGVHLRGARHRDHPGRVIGPVVNKIGEAKGVIVGGFLRVLGNAIMAFFPRIYPAAAGSAIAGIGGGIAQPCASALLTFHAPDVARGRIIGINQSAMSLGNIIGPLVGGFVYDLNPAWPPMVSMGVRCRLVALGLTQPDKPTGPAPAMAGRAA